MKILRITKSQLPNSEKIFLDQHGMKIFELPPTLLSAVTAFKISKAVTKYDIDIVEVFNQNDAIAALSAKKLNSKKKYKVIYHVLPNENRSRHLHKEVIEKIDGWIFASNRLSQLFNEELKNRIVINPIALEAPDILPPNTDSDKIILWLGDIKNTDKLKKLLEAVEGIKTNFSLRICGAGSAREVMPIVRYSRNLAHRDRIVWRGEEFNQMEEIENCICAIQTDHDISVTETLIQQTGRPVIQPEELEVFLNAPYTIKPDKTPERYITELHAYYITLQ